MLGPEDVDRLRAEFDAQRRDLSAAEAGAGRQRRTASVLRAIEPYYSLATPSTVPLYAGPLLFQPGEGKTAEQVEGTISLELTPRPQVLVQGAARKLLHFQDLLNPVSRLQLPTMSSLPPAPQGPFNTADSSWLGPPRGYVVGKSAAVSTVTFHLINFMRMPGTVITDGNDVWSGRVVVTLGPWVVTLDGRSDLPQILRRLADHGGYAVTHTCTLERPDGRVFAFARSEELLTCLTWCLWFCRASAPAVVLPVGFDKSNHAIWSRWAAPHTDPLPDGHWHWFDQAYGAEQISMLLPLFFERWSDPAWQIPLARAIRYYADASEGTLQRKIVLAQVALELLAFTHRVTATQQLKAREFKPPVRDHIRQLLVDLGIPTTIPRHFYGLRKVRAETPWDGPTAITWLRNDIVHPNRGRVHASRWKLWYQGWQLSMWYLELAILAVVKYDGRYRDRIAGQPDTGAVEPVPWASA